ncbi:hypothetical protein BRADI_3g52195v3 [Brachypodium distachyon]|uniref:F-box domain-containing protein n=1 Tax=Brachypodium distachyon TaxID=15368 RepID=A0A0Q3FRT6_BRADI|nr:hypothetical protein BRADI_3g52195v3 [Brachypodium distachyon]
MPAADALPDDVILEILARVPDAPSLLRCAAVCRCWRALVANPSFLRRRWPDSAYSLLGFFVPKKLNRGDHEAISFLPGPRSALADGSRLLSSFVPDAAGLPAACVYPLTSHDGLLLLSLRLLNRIHAPRVLAVCSLLAGTCHVLPPFEWYLCCVGHAVLTSADFRQLPPSSSSSSFFKVLMIVLGKDGTGYDLHTFVSGQPSWNAPTKCSSRVPPGFVMHGDAVVCQGAAYWLFCESSCFHVLAVDAETGRVSSTKLTSPVSPWPDHADLNVQRGGCRLATTTDGKLLSLCLYDAGLQLVEIWTRPAAGHGVQDWPRTGLIDLKPILDQQPQQGRSVCLGGGCGKLLIMLAHRHGYIANLQTGTIQEVDDNQSSSRPVTSTVVCMEIDWTKFFMARLA